MTETISGRIYTKLRSEIVAAALPPGEKLRIEPLCDRYGVTSTPMREALNQLASEGFVLRQAQRGFTVAGASVKELQELMQTRCWVEAIALREAIGRHTPEWGAAIHSSFAKLEATERSTDPNEFQENPTWEGAHQAFHMALIATCPSHWLIAFCRQLSDHATRYRRLAMSAVYPRRDVMQEHRAILLATLAGDAEAAVTALEHHYRKTATIVVEAGLGSRR